MIIGCVVGCSECERLDKAHMDACKFSIKHGWSFGIFADRKVKQAQIELEEHIDSHKVTTVTHPAGSVTKSEDL